MATRELFHDGRRPRKPRRWSFAAADAKSWNKIRRQRAFTALARLSLWCLRHPREPWELVDRLGAWLDLVREVRRAPHARAALVLIMRCIFATNEPNQPEALVQRLFAAVGEQGKEEIMTAADQLWNEDASRGVAKCCETASTCCRTQRSRG